jgi:hypothetical protein
MQRARQQRPAPQATEQYLPPESRRIGTVASWGRCWMSGLEFTLNYRHVMFQGPRGCISIPSSSLTPSSLTWRYIGTAKCSLPAKLHRTTLISDFPWPAPQVSIAFYKKDVKKKAPPRPESGFVSRDPAHFRYASLEQFCLFILISSSWCR